MVTEAEDKENDPAILDYNGWYCKFGVYTEWDVGHHQDLPTNRSYWYRREGSIRYRHMTGTPFHRQHDGGNDLGLLCEERDHNWRTG